MPRRILEGKVVSDKTDKTVTVLVERRFMHPIYKKYLKRTDKYAAHDELNAFRVGDAVEIQECRPISKSKRWTVITEVPSDRVEEVNKNAAEKQAQRAAAVPAKKPAAKTAAKPGAKAAAPKAAAPKADAAPVKKPAAEKKPAADKPAAKTTKAKKAE